MARMSLDDADRKDPRLWRVGARFGMDRRAMLGTMIDVRDLFHDLRSLHVDVASVDEVAGHDGFAAALVDAGLAVTERRGFTLHGIEKSVGYLLNHHERSANGGRKSGEVRRAKAEARRALQPEPAGSTKPPHRLKREPVLVEPSFSGSGSLSGSGSDLTDQNAVASAPAEAGASVLELFPDQPRKDPAPSDRYTEVVAAYFDAFKAANAGKSPTMGAKQGAMLKRLIKQHGADEVIRRIKLLWSGRLSWPPPPYDLNSLVQHFDRLAASGATGGRYEPEGR